MDPAVDHAVDPAVDPAVDLASLVPLAGGWSGQTFVAEGPEGRQVVRIYATPGRRGSHAQDVDAALLRLVRGLVPVPAVLEVRRPDPDAGLPGLLVTDFAPGERGDLLLARLDGPGLARLGAGVGRLLARLGSMPFLRPGELVDGDLTVRPWPEVDADGLPGVVEAHLERLAWWSDDEVAGLREVARQAQHRLDGVDGAADRACLVHSDLNPKNWLADPDTLEITALLDWEFAHAGHPASDLGNTLRFDRDPAYADAVLDAYLDGLGGLGGLGGERGETLDLARCADLRALVDLASRRGTNPVTVRADDLLRAIARARDVHAVDRTPT